MRVSTDSASPLDKHHIFGGKNRQKSDKLGLVVYLCRLRLSHLRRLFGARSLNMLCKESFTSTDRKKQCKSLIGQPKRFIRVLDKLFIRKEVLIKNVNDITLQGRICNDIELPKPPQERRLPFGLNPERLVSCWEKNFEFAIVTD